MKAFAYAAVLSLSAMLAQAGTITDSLLSNTLNSSLWTVSQTTANLYTVTPTLSGLDLAYDTSTPNPSGGTQVVGINLNLAALGGNISGDFSLSVDFSNAVLAGGGLDQVELHTAYTDSSIFFDSDSSGSSGVHVWTGAVQTTASPEVAAGTFTISRTGSTLAGYYDSTLLFSETGSTADLDSIALTLQNNNSSLDPTSVTFTNFSLTAASVGTPEPGTLWLFAGALMALIAAARIRRLRRS